MRHVSQSWLVTLIAFLLGGILLADPLDDAMDAAVFVKVQATHRSTQDRLGATGSGFVVQSDKTGLYIVTNWHVVTLTEPSRYIIHEYVGVLRSHTPREETVKLDLLAVDPVNDLALLHAPPVTDPPKPLALGEIVEPELTEQLTVIGFPLGSRLDLENKNPAVTVTRATVSQPYRDRFGAQLVLPLNGSADHGNSGGPVVDRRGRLAGVLVSGFEGTQAIQVIPARHVRNLWDGVYMVEDVSLTKGHGLDCEFAFVLASVDPFRNIVGARLVALPIGQLTPDLDRDSFHRLAEKCVSVPFEPLPSKARSTRIVSATVTAPDTGQGRFVAALQITRRDGTTWLGRPVRFSYPGVIRPQPLTIDLGEADVLLGKASATGGGSDDRIDEYGRAQNRIGDTTIKMLSASGNLRILKPDLGFSVAAGPCWLGDGSTAAVLDRRGWVVKIAFPSFRKAAARELAWGIAEGTFAGQQAKAHVSCAALARSRSSLLVLSQSLDTNHGAPVRSWLHMLDPDSLELQAFLPVSSVVGISAVPESDHVILRHASGQLSLLDPTTCAISPLAHPASFGGLRTTETVGTTVALPGNRVADAVLMSPGDRLLVLVDSRVVPYQFIDRHLAPFEQENGWGKCVGVRYTPGQPVAILSGDPRGRNPTRLVEVASLRSKQLPPAGWLGGLDLKERCFLAVEGSSDHPVLQRIELSNGTSQTTALPDLSIQAETGAFAPHPRGNCYWVGSRGEAFWLETGDPWVEPSTTPAPIPKPASPTENTAGNQSAGHYLGHVGDLDVWQLDLPTSSAVGACWTPGADTFIVALEGGKLHAIDQRNMRVVEEAELNKPCHAIALSGVGPVVTLGNGEARELVLLDPRTLVARSSFPLPASSDVAVGERSPLALVSVPGQGIQLTDIRTGQIVAKADRVPLPNGREDLSLAKATSVCLDASGSYAYAMAEGRLVSLRLSGKSMQLHQLLPPSTGRNGLVTLSGVGISADGLLLDIFGTAKAGHEVHDIRYARDFGTLCRRFTGPTLVVFDCGAGRVLRGGGNRDVAYPFSSSRLDSSINRVIRNPFYPRLGRIVLPHPRGNRLVVVGDRIHVLQYSSGLIR